MAHSRRVLILLLATLITACNIEIQVPEGGQVRNLSGSIACGPSETCVIDIGDSFDDGFIAVPEPGFVFTAWQRRPRGLCGGRAARCYLTTIGFESSPFLDALLASDETYFLEPQFVESEPLAAFETIDALPGGGDLTLSGGISPDGSALVGQSQYGFGRNSLEAFRWMATEGTIGLGDLEGPAVQSEAHGASLRGSAVTGCGTSDVAVEGLLGVQEAFRWTLAGGMQALGDLPGGQFRSCGLGISADGTTVVGTGRTERGIEAFRWRANTGIEALADLPGGGFESAAYATSAGGQVSVGYSTSGRGIEAVRWLLDEPVEQLGDLPGGRFVSVATAVSLNSDVIAGRGEVDYLFDSRTSINEPFMWTETGGIRTLGSLFPRLLNSEPTPVAVAADGDVIVGREGARLWLWTERHGLRELQDVLIGQGATELVDWRLTTVTGMSSDGRTLTGDANGPFGSRVWRATFNPRFP